MKKKQLMVICGILAAALCFGGCGKIDGTQTVLTVNEDTVSMGAAMFDLRYQQAEMYSYYEQMYAMYGMKMDGYWSTETTDTSSEDSEASETSETSETSTASETSAASETSEASTTSEASESSETSSAASETAESSTTDSGKKITYGQQFKNSVMDSLTDMVLLSQHADEYGVSISDEDETAIKEAAQQFVDDNDADMLAKNGITADSVAEYMRLYTIYARMQDPMVADVDTNVSDDEAKKSTITYVRIKEDTSSSTDSSEDASSTEETETKKFDSLKDEAQAVLDRLKQESDIANADIETIAQEVGDDTFTVQVSYDADDMVYDSKLKEAANTLSDGQLYDGVIEGADGNYYLVRMDSVLDREKTDANKETIVSNRKSDAYDQIVAGWKDAAEITVNESLWKKATVEDAEQYRTKAEDSSSATSETAESSAAAESSSAASEAETGSATAESSSVASEAGTSSAAVETSSVASEAEVSSAVSETETSSTAE